MLVFTANGGGGGSSWSSVTASVNTQGVRSGTGSVIISWVVTPTSAPSSRPSRNPSASPTAVPSLHPSTSPSAVPSFIPSIHPSSIPSSIPSSTHPSIPSLIPSSIPSSIPSATTSSIPSSTASSIPSSSMKPTLLSQNTDSNSDTSSRTNQLSTSNIIIIAVVCSLCLIALVSAVVYYCYFYYRLNEVDSKGRLRLREWLRSNKDTVNVTVFESPKYMQSVLELPSSDTKKRVTSGDFHINYLGYGDSTSDVSSVSSANHNHIVSDNSSKMRLDQDQTSEVVIDPFRSSFGVA